VDFGEGRGLVEAGVFGVDSQVVPVAAWALEEATGTADFTLAGKTRWFPGRASKNQ
jgi:hypothetical protein